MIIFGRLIPLDVIMNECTLVKAKGFVGAQLQVDYLG